MRRRAPWPERLRKKVEELVCDVARDEDEQRRRIAERLERQLAELAIRQLPKTKGVDDDAQ